jgi:AAA+ ATPase superfamily predicted ATPase
MVFIGGPRQVGKTTLAKHILETAGFSGRYFNWDYGRDRFDRVIKEDIRDLTEVRQISLLELFIHQLRTRVGGQIVARLRHPFSRGRLQIVDPVTYFHQSGSPAV